jgi:hypothetical protein
MARAKRLELTPVPSERGRQRWAKIYQGKKHYFRGTYEEALDLWHQKLVEIEQAAEAAEGYHVKLCRKMHQWFKEHPGEWERAGGRHPLSAEYAGPTDEKDARFKWRSISDEGRAVWFERFRQMDAPTSQTTVAKAVAQFLEKAKAKAELGQISAGRYDTLARCANHFAKHVSGQKAIASINGVDMHGLRIDFLT